MLTVSELGNYKPAAEREVRNLLDPKMQVLATQIEQSGFNPHAHSFCIEQPPPKEDGSPGDELPLLLDGNHRSCNL